MDAKIVEIGKVTLINGNLHVNYGNPGHQVVVIVPQELQSKVEVRVKPILSHLGDMTLNSKRITKRSEVIEGPEWFSFLEKIKLKQIRVVANIDFVDPLKEDNPGLIGKGARQSEGAAPHNELYDFKAKAPQVTLIIPWTEQDYNEALNNVPWPWYLAKGQTEWRAFDESDVEAKADPEPSHTGTFTITITHYMDPSVGVDSKCR